MSTPSDIRIRANFYLWLLTGRSKGFTNASLNTGVNYTLRSTPDEIIYARSFLELESVKSDVNVLSVLAASLMSKAMLRDMPADGDVVFVPGLLRLPQVTCNATLLGQGENSWGYIDGSIAGEQRFNRVHITRLSDTKVQIETDSGRKESSEAVLTNVAGGTFRLHVRNAEKYGIFADFGVSQWNSVDYITVTMARTRFPYADVVAKLRKDRTMMRLMNAENTLATFESAPANPALQVGMAGLAVIRRMLKWVSEDQAGFTVTLEDGTDLREPLGRVYKFAPALIDGLSPAPVTPDQPIGFDV